MIIELPNPSQVALQVTAQYPDGTSKDNITSGSVRVYYMNGAVETDVLSSVSLVQVGATSTWRYLWSPSSLAVEQYVAEYTLTDSDALISVVPEDLVVRDFAIQADLEIVKQVETGRWHIVANQMIFYEDDGLTEVMRFDLFDSVGTPTMGDVFQRVRV